MFLVRAGAVDDEMTWQRCRSGERAGIRTLDLLIKSQLLYRLSYALPKAARRPRNCGGT